MDRLNVSFHWDIPHNLSLSNFLLCRCYNQLSFLENRGTLIFMLSYYEVRNCRFWTFQVNMRDLAVSLNWKFNSLFPVFDVNHFLILWRKIRSIFMVSYCDFRVKNIQWFNFWTKTGVASMQFNHQERLCACCWMKEAV